MLLITELNEDVQYIREATESGEKKYYIEGVIMQSNLENRNGRMYPRNVMMKEVDRYNREYVAKKRAFGELGHPSGPTINLDRGSHIFTELKADGDNVVGRAKIMDTPMGKIVKNYIDEGAQLGISSRGLGSLKKNSKGIMEVQNDFMLATAGDIVADPSAPSAFVNGIMEGVSFYYDLASGSFRSANEFDRIEEEIRTTAKQSSKALEEKAIRLFEDFMKSL
jgi:hypothetical protein